MKSLLTIVCLIAFAAGATAQYKETVQRVDSLTATGVTTAAKNTRGYDTYKVITTLAGGGIGMYKDKMFSVYFTKITDTIQVQGGTLRFGNGISTNPYFTVAEAGKADTVWMTLRVRLKNYSKNGFAYGTQWVPERDTLVKYISPVGTDQMNFNIDASEYYYPYYRFISGVNDTGKTYINTLARGGF